MVTVWPLDSEIYTWLNNPTSTSGQDVCTIAVDHYGLVTAQMALKDAAHTGVNINTIGPLLLAWSPSTDKGKDHASVLVSNLSDITTYDQALEMFLAWSREIERDPTLWRNGWNLERLRIKVQLWVDKYGARSLAIFRVKG
jgi:hypothetical protein